MFFKTGVLKNFANFTGKHRRITRGGEEGVGGRVYPALFKKLTKMS